MVNFEVLRNRLKRKNDNFETDLVEDEGLSFEEESPIKKEENKVADIPFDFFKIIIAGNGENKEVY